MKRLFAVTTVAIALLLAAPAAWAQDQGDGQGNDGGRRGARQRGGERQAGGERQRGGMRDFDPAEMTKRLHDRLVTELKVTDDQKAKFDAAFNQWADQDKADFEKQRQAFRDARGDREKTQKLFEGMRANREAGNKKLGEALAPILTEDQKKQLPDLLQAGRGFGGGQVPLPRLVMSNAEELGLTADQKTKLEELIKANREASAKLGADDSKGRQELSDKLNADIKALLTDEQKTKLAKLQAQPARTGFGQRNTDGQRGGGNFLERNKDLGLTESQQKAIKDLQDAFDTASKSATPEDRRSLNEKLRKDIREVLTPEQREKMDKAREGRQTRPAPAPAPAATN